MENKIYIKLSEYARNHSITYKTAWRRFKDGKIEEAYKDEFGNILIPIGSSFDYSKCVCYARVSSNGMKDNLIRQQNRLEEFAVANGYEIVKSVREIASGMNDKRPKLIKILENDSWNTLIVEHKDRLTRFGFNYIETLLKTKGKKIIIINKTNEDKEDIMNDLISIIYSFSARIYGLRKKKNKKEIIKFLES